MNNQKMKTIGLLGGTSWVSTIEYYKLLNQIVVEKLGKQHSAKIVLNSIDYETIKKYNYQDWDKIGEVLMDEILKLDSFGVDCILICNNTLHKAYEDIEPHLYIDTPIFHIADCVGEYANKKKYKNLVLLGTKFTMEEDFYKKRLSSSFGLSIFTPEEKDRIEIQRIIQEELVKEKFLPETRDWFKNLIGSFNEIEGVILGCTELPLIIKQKDYQIPILNTMELHCEKAVSFAL